MQPTGRQRVLYAHLFSCFCKPPQDTENNTIHEQRKVVDQSVRRQCTPPDTSANQNAVNKNKILERMKTLERGRVCLTKNINDRNKKIAENLEKLDYDDMQDLLAVRKRLRKNLHTFETELAELSQQIKSLEEPRVEQNPKMPSTSAAKPVSPDKADENIAKSLPRQQGHQEASKERKI